MFQSIIYGTYQLTIHSAVCRYTACMCFFPIVASGNIEGGVPDLLPDFEALQALTSSAASAGGTCKVGSQLSQFIDTVMYLIGKQVYNACYCVQGSTQSFEHCFLFSFQMVVCTYTVH